MRYLGFLLLTWFPGGLRAQSAAQPCAAPKLVGGYFFHEQDADLIYACDDGYKPVVEGWWATSTCHNGTWSHVPQCIDESACIPPTIANAKYTEATGGWFEEGHTIRITCDDGYEHKNNLATAHCRNGTWSTLPSCEKRGDACSEPPRIPHAVVVHRGHQELFPAESVVHYECEDGYSIEASQRNSSICLAGTWTDGPTCSLRTGRVVELGGSAEVGRGGGGGGATPAGRGTLPGVGGSRPDTGSIGSAEVGTGGGRATSTGHGTQPGGGGMGGRGGQRGGSRGSSSSSSSSSDSKPLFMPIDNCGTYPTVAHGDVVQTAPMSLKYKCSAFYQLVGTEDVVCYNDGTWSTQPTCKEAFCLMKPGNYGYLKLLEVRYINEGKQISLPCRWPNYSLAARCTDGTIFHTDCCRSDDHYYQRCYWAKLPPVASSTAA